MADIVIYVLIMQGLCTGVLCMTLIIVANQFTEAMSAQSSSAKQSREVVLHRLDLCEAAVRSTKHDMESAFQDARNFVLMARHWARVASAGWAQPRYYDGTVGD